MARTNRLQQHVCLCDRIFCMRKPIWKLRVVSHLIPGIVIDNGFIIFVILSIFIAFYNEPRNPMLDHLFIILAHVVYTQSVAGSAHPNPTRGRDSSRVVAGRR